MQGLANVSSATESPLRTRAMAEARENWNLNLKALHLTQPSLASSLSPPLPAPHWIYARDGSLSVLNDLSSWWSGCSLPRRAAQEMLRKLAISATTACFLAPSHAQQVVVALQILKAEQALIVIVPELLELQIALHCHDFTADLARHRLWFAAGQSW